MRFAQFLDYIVTTTTTTRYCVVDGNLVDVD